jgi:hypothetical protein
MQTFLQPDKVKNMDNASLSHRSTAKASIRSLIKERGLADFLRLTGEVVSDFLAKLAARTDLSAADIALRDEAFKAISAVLPLVEEAEAESLEAVAWLLDE